MVTGPSEMLSFTWDKLAKIDKKADYQKKTNKGVSVTLRELRQEGAAGDQVWTVGLFLEYPPDGPKFESFQSWIVNNEIHFVREKDGLKQQMPPNLGTDYAREFDAANLHLLTVHHKDGNHHNNPPDGSNWENLCVDCHEDEHSRDLLGDYLTGKRD